MIKIKENNPENYRPAVVTDDCNHSTLEDDAGGSLWVQGQPKLHHEILSQKRQNQQTTPPP